MPGLVTGLAWRSFGVAMLILFVLVLLFMYRGTRLFISDFDIQFRKLLFAARGFQQPDEQTRVLGITENTISAFAGIQVYYPFPRNWHALAIRRLADAGARVVVFDILFSEKDSWDESEDQSLAEAIIYARDKGCQVVLAAASERISYAPGVFSDSLLQPAPAILAADPALGMSNALDKLDYKQIEIVSISLPLGEGGADVTYYTQAVEAFRQICAVEGRDFEAELARAVTAVKDQRSDAVRRYFTVNYYAPPDTFPGHVYSYESLFVNELNESESGASGSAEAERLKRVFDGTVVFVGSRAHADNDYFRTPYGKMFGVDTNAQAYDTLNRGRRIRTITPLATLALVGLFTIIAWWISLLRPISRAVLLSLIPLFAISLLLAGLFRYAGIEGSVLMLNAGFLLPFIGCTVYGGVAEELAKRRIRDTFGRYVSSEIVSQIISDPGLADLGGVERQVAVLFSDIRSYSTITEDMTPYQIVEMLNIYLSEMTEIVRRNGGFVDKYMGDGLMACFGGPVPTVDPAGDATRAALEMVNVLKTRVAEALKAGGFPEFNIGIGLHYGPVVMGNIGSATRMDYTVIGDAVNVASRVEGQTKEFGTAVITTRDCLDSAIGEFSAEFIGERQVKGRERPVMMYSLVDPLHPERFKY